VYFNLQVLVVIDLLEEYLSVKLNRIALDPGFIAFDEVLNVELRQLVCLSPSLINLFYLDVDLCDHLDILWQALLEFLKRYPFLLTVQLILQIYKNNVFRLIPFLQQLPRLRAQRFFNLLSVEINR
jgi:hypothetical protein